MPARRDNFVRSTTIALITGGLLLIGMVGSVVYLVYKTQTYVENTAKARRVRSAAADLLLSIQDAETGQRGYLLTREESFLKPYLASLREMSELWAGFETALVQADYLSVDTSTLQSTKARKMEEMRQTLALAQSGQADKALEIMRNQSGRKLMDDLRSTLSKVMDESDRRIADQLGKNVDLATLLRFTTIAVAVAIIAILLALIGVIRRYVQEIYTAREALEQLNTGLEDRIRERTEDLISANQEIQRYAYIVTHDLRAPLVNIMGFTSELDSALKSINAYFSDERGPDGDVMREEAERAVREDLPEAIAFIRSSTRKMDELINAILKISRDGRRQLKPEPIDLDGLIENSVAAVQHQVAEADGRIDINVRIRGFVSDQFSLQQILGNLLDNALKYRDRSRPLALGIDAYHVNRLTVAIDVEDNGRGIAAEDHERIFELFRRSGAQDSPGEGIGLAHVRSLVRNMGGDIQVSSELGRGTKFMIRLPTDLSQYVRSLGQ